MSTIVTRAGKGSPLTNNEVDANFVNLNTDKIQVTGTPTTGQAPIWNGTAWVPGTAGAGTVTSVAATGGTGISVTGSPITSSGTLNITNTAPLPTGGAAGQILAKNTATDYDAGWIDNYATQLKFQAKNVTGGTLNKGTVVYVSGGAGANPYIAAANASADSTSATTVGILESTVANNDFGLVVESGVISRIDTSAAVDGDPVWLSGTTPGGMVFGIANKPQAPIHIVYLGTVTRAHAVNGEIQVKVNNGWELEELHNVQINSPTGEYTQELAYQASTGLWKNYTKSTSTIAEGTNLYYTDTRVRAAVSGTAPVSYSSSTGVFSMAAASASANGYLTSTDWSTFNSKQPAGTYVNSVSATSPITSTGGVTPTIAIPAASSSANGYLTSTDWSTFNGKATYPTQTGNAGKYLKTDGTNTSWGALPTYLPLLLNSGSTSNISIANGFLAVLLNSGSTANITVS